MIKHLRESNNTTARTQTLTHMYMSMITDLKIAHK